MRLLLWSIGKEHEAYVKAGVEEFTKRLSKFYPVSWTILPAPKNAGNLPEADWKRRESELVQQWLKPDDYLVALDEKGKQMTSEELARFIQLRANESVKNLVFLIGGAYGLDDRILAKAKFRWSLSQLTFPHHLVRLILSEQLYRACTILRNEKYHHK